MAVVARAEGEKAVEATVVVGGGEARRAAGRPRGFNRVISHVGSFTNIRGGHNFPWLIRNTPRKPIQVFLQSDKNDLNNQHEP